MKTLIQIISFLLFIVALFFFYEIYHNKPNPHHLTDNSKLALESVVYDMGKVGVAKKVTREVKFYNRGTSPLIVYNVVTSCGCVSAKWPEEPIMPGSSGVLSVSFQSKTQARFRKVLKIYANIEKGSVDLLVKGEVTE
ncbi:MAG: DUF1573 domain-containing protein [Marinifilaceae bacterium]